MVRGGAQAFNDNLAFANFQRALGTHSAAALRIENERIELMAKSIRTLLEPRPNSLKRVGSKSRRTRRRRRRPPEHCRGGAPALAAMYTATIAAITKTAPVKVSGTAEPLAPQSEKLKVIYEALGNFFSKERLEAMLKDERKLKEWMKMVQGLIKTKRLTKNQLMQ